MNGGQGMGAEDQLPPGSDVGVFEWDVQDDSWDWSEEMYAVHGYRPGAVVPSREVVLAHKLPQDRPQAERYFSAAQRPGFRFQHLHGIRDATGSERIVLSVGAASTREDERGPRQVVRGFMVDLTSTRREAVQRLVQAAPVDPRLDGPDLSEREAQVLQLIAAGCSNAEIARELFVSINTVKTYVRTAYRKIGARRRSQAVLWVMDHQ